MYKRQVTYDSDAPTCRSLFINQATAEGLGESEVDIIASEIHDTGEIGIVSASASDTNQNTWIQWMKVELKKYPKVTLEPVVYGNDDTAMHGLVEAAHVDHLHPDAGIALSLIHI